MPSQPDYARAHQLSPHLKPTDPADQLAKDKQVLAERLAKAEGKTVDQVLKELTSSQAPAADQPIVTPPPAEVTAPPAVTREDAKFFANKEGTKYYPVEKLAQAPFSKLKAEKVVYFKSKEDAEAASFVAA